MSDTAVEKASGKKKKRKRKSSETFLMCFMILTVFGMYAGFLHLIDWLFVGKDVEDWAVRGQFGDVFGALNTLFSGLAFALLVVTLRLQREELRLQRKESRASRRELGRTANAQAASQQSLARQADSMLESARSAQRSAELLERHESSPLAHVVVFVTNTIVPIYNNSPEMLNRTYRTFPTITILNNGRGIARSIYVEFSTRFQNDNLNIIDNDDEWNPEGLLSIRTYESLGPDSPVHIRLPEICEPEKHRFRSYPIHVTWIFHNGDRDITRDITIDPLIFYQ